MAVWRAPVRAQMSPGELSRAHHDLDSPLRCGACHEFGARKARFRCLNCHAGIRRRLEERRGYHARVVRGTEAEASNECAQCHSEHNGRNHRLVRWKTPRNRFDHREAGWALEGKHARLACEQCHNPQKTAQEERGLEKRTDPSASLLGLNARCTACHEDAHRGQLGQECSRCHASETWKPASRFSHEKTNYPLTGLHERVACEKCHRKIAALGDTVQYRNFVSTKIAGPATRIRMEARLPVTVKRATTLQVGKGRASRTGLTTARRNSRWPGATGRWNAGNAIKARTSARLCPMGGASIAIGTATRASLRAAAAESARLVIPRPGGSRPASAPPSTLQRSSRSGASMRQSPAGHAIPGRAPVSTTIRPLRVAISATRTATAGSSQGPLMETAANTATKKPHGRRFTIRCETTAGAGSRWLAPTLRFPVPTATRKGMKGESSAWRRRPAAIAMPILTSARLN